MPNYCENRWKISGLEEDVAAAMADLGIEPDGGGEMTFANLRPLPEVEPDPPGGVKGVNFQNACIKAWGTKWEPFGVSQDYCGEGDTCVHVSFQTAWTPPEPVYKALAAKYPELDVLAHYYESGMDLFGYLGHRLISEKNCDSLADNAIALACIAARIDRGHPGEWGDLSKILKGIIRDQCEALGRRNAAEEVLDEALAKIEEEEDGD